MADAMETLAELGPSGLLEKANGPEWEDPADAFIAELTRRVAGDGTTVVDAALRRAIASSAGRLLDEYPEVSEAIAGPETTGGRGMAGELLCLLYQWFFADLIKEFLQAVIAEKIKLAVPVLELADPEGGIADGVAARILALIPSPCEEAAETSEAAAQAVTDEPEAELPLSEVARRLVPGTVGKILGLAVDALGEEEAAA